nr:hypothetical protein [Tanacetum cinerariifolium]
MDDEPMWASDRVFALTLGFAITIPETANKFAIKVMSSSNHPIIVSSDSDIKDAFSSTNVPDYFLATSKNTYPDSSNDLTKFPSSLEISPPKDAEIPVESSILVSPSSSVGSSSSIRSITPPPDYPFDESIFVELDNSLWIIPRPLESKPVLEKPNELDAHLWK